MAKIKLLAGEKIPRESAKSIRACNDYLRMGIGRSLKKLIQKYIKSEETERPTKAIGTLMNWSSRYGWVKRAEIYDAEQDEIRSEHARTMFKEGLSLDFERVAELKKLFDLLLLQLGETDDEGNLFRLWLPDAKGIGKGENFEKIDIERYNSPLIGDIRAVLDDLAKETGGRIKKTENDLGLAEITVKLVNDMRGDE